MTVIELKAQAYDILAQIEALQKALGQVNQLILEAHRKEPKDDNISVAKPRRSRES